MTNSEQQSRLDGQLAAVRGKSLSACPYPLNGPLGRAWRHGWTEITRTKAEAA
jgi:ribosome modulation factor